MDLLKRIMNATNKIKEDPYAKITGIVLNHKDLREAKNIPHITTTIGYPIAIFGIDLYLCPKVTKSIILYKLIDQNKVLACVCKEL